MGDLKKLFQILNTEQKRSAYWLFSLMIFGMILEMVGVGLVIPLIVILTQQNLLTSDIFLGQIISMMEPQSQISLVTGAMFILLGIYLLKSLFLSFLAIKRANFAFGLQAALSKRLFSTYLNQPYIFFLKRNSAQLIRNISTEITVLTGYVIIPSLLFIAEVLVFAGLCGILIFVEPISTLIVVTLLGCIIFSFYYFMKYRITAWGTSKQFHEGKIIQHIQQGLGSIKDVKILGR